MRRGRLIETLIALLLPLALGAVALRVYVDRAQEYRAQIVHYQQMQSEALERAAQAGE